MGSILKHIIIFAVIFVTIFSISVLDGVLVHGEGIDTVESTVKISDSTNGGPTLTDEDYFGVSAANIGDLNGDGIIDLAVGASGDDTGGSGRGSLYILFMKSDGTISSSVQIAESTNGGPTTITNGDQFGWAVANIGDLDSDGVTDLAVTANADDTGGSTRGAVYTLFMNSDGTVDSFKRIASATNGGPTLDNNDRFGWSVANIGDLDSDGVTDLAVGTILDDTGGTDRGALYILFMKTDGTVDSSVQIGSGTNGGPTLTDGDELGGAVANIGDLDGDGVTDLAVGATKDDTGGTNRGALYIFFMKNDGTVNSFKKIASDTNGGPTLADTDIFGKAVANIGDRNGDGVNDIAVSALRDDTGGTDRGAVYFLYMKTDGTVSSFVKIADNTRGGPSLSDDVSFGSAIANMDDFNGAGIVDLVVGSSTDNTGGTDRGAFYFLFFSELVSKSGSKSNLDTRPPSFTDNFREGEFPLEIMGLNYSLPNYYNKINTTIVNTGKPVDLKFRLHDNRGPQNIAHVGLYTDFDDESLDPTFSNTNIVWDRYGGVTSQDASRNLLDYSVSIGEKGDKFESTFKLAFAKPIGLIDFVIRVWDSARNGYDLKLIEPFEIVGNPAPEGPTITDIIADDPDGGDDTQFSDGDTITIRFSESTNQPPVSTKEELDLLLSFSETLANDYSGEWTNPSTLVITTLDTNIPFPPKIGVFTVTVKEEGNLRNSQGNSYASTSTSPALDGGFAPFSKDLPVSSGDTAKTTLPSGISVAVTPPEGGIIQISKTTIDETLIQEERVGIIGNVIDIVPKAGASCEQSCVIEFSFNDDDLNSASTTLENVRIFHDKNSDDDFDDPWEELLTTVFPDFPPGPYVAKADAPFTSKFAVGGAVSLAILGAPVYHETVDQLDLLLLIQKWAGYHEESITDSQLLEALGFEGDSIPLWVRQTFGKGINDGHLGVEDLIIAIKHLLELGILG